MCDCGAVTIIRWWLRAGRAIRATVDVLLFVAGAIVGDSFRLLHDSGWYLAAMIGTLMVVARTPRNARGDEIVGSQTQDQRIGGES